MANAPHLFEDLWLTPGHKKVDGIGGGLEVKGTGTLVLRIQDDDGKVHTICIPNSLYFPILRQCLLLPQHWAQEAKAMGGKGKTWMEYYWDKCVLCWKGGKFLQVNLFQRIHQHTNIFTPRLLSKVIEPL